MLAQRIKKDEKTLQDRKIYQAFPSISYEDKAFLKGKEIL